MYYLAANRDQSDDVILFSFKISLFLHCKFFLIISWVFECRTLYFQQDSAKQKNIFVFFFLTCFFFLIYNCCSLWYWEKTQTNSGFYQRPGWFLKNRIFITLEQQTLNNTRMFQLDTDHWYIINSLTSISAIFKANFQKGPQNGEKSRRPLTVQWLKHL